MTNAQQILETPAPRHGVSRVAVLAFILAMCGALTLLASGLGSRWEWWGFRTGLTMIRYSFFIGLAAVVVSIIAVILTRSGSRPSGFGLALAGLVLGVIVAALPLQAYRTAKSVPAIHDISTDTENPPAFVAILPLRADAANPAEYGGVEVAAQQHKAYPDIGPASLNVPKAEAFDRALATARHMGWEIVAADPAKGVIEATATTFWFGFKDDVVVRVSAADGGSRVDVRSVSRVGKSDVGTNAKRIRKFLTSLQETK